MSSDGLSNAEHEKEMNKWRLITFAGESICRMKIRLESAGSEDTVAAIASRSASARHSLVHRHSVNIGHVLEWFLCRPLRFFGRRKRLCLQEYSSRIREYPRKTSPARLSARRGGFSQSKLPANLRALCSALAGSPQLPSAKYDCFLRSDS